MLEAYINLFVHLEIGTNIVTNGTWNNKITAMVTADSDKRTNPGTERSFFFSFFTPCISFLICFLFFIHGRLKMTDNYRIDAIGSGF